MRGVMIAIALCLAPILGIGQPKLTVSQTNALIGDRLTMYVEMSPSMGEGWANKEVVPADTVRAIQLLTPATILSESGKYTVTWDFAVFDTGYVRIPPIPIVVSRSGRMDTLYSNDVPLLIQGVVDSVGMAPLKPIVYEPVRFEDYLPYILGAIGLLAVIALMWWWSKRPKKTEEVVEEEVILPPHVIALSQLDTLQEENLWQQGAIKEYHSRLNIILRGYLERRYGVATLESTTREVSVLLKPILTETQFGDMMQMLQLEDLIKFAKAQPPADIHEKYFDFVRQFILSTAEEEKPDVNND